MLTSLMAWAHGHHQMHHPAGSFEHQHNLIMHTESLTDLLMTEMPVRPPMESMEVQGTLSLPAITAWSYFQFL
jgi:hypothetical protein